MAMLAFISYSHKDRRLAGLIKSGLEAFGFNIFLAHEDLAPCAEWQGNIVRKVKACHILLPLITKQFHGSAWTDQEVGAAVILKKCIVPLKVGNDPYGFMGKFQAQKITLRNEVAIEKYCWRIVRSLCEHRRLAEDIKHALVERFVDSRSYSESARVAEFLLNVNDFTSGQPDTTLTKPTQHIQLSTPFF